MAQTHQDYYENEDNFGKYQYVPLSEVINRIYLDAQTDGHLLAGTKRSKIIALAKEGLRELTIDVAKDVLGFEITVPDSLVFPLPQDSVGGIEVFLVNRDGNTGNFEMFELDNSSNMITDIGYLQDNDANLLFDNNGLTLEADSSNAINKPYGHIKNTTDRFGNQATKDTSKYSNYGTFAINERRGIIVFSSNLADKEVVVKYKSDGLQAELLDSEVSVHKYLRKPLQDYIFYECLLGMRNVSESRINTAKNKYKSSRHKAVLHRSDFNLTRISKIMDASTKIF